MFVIFYNTNIHIKWSVSSLLMNACSDNAEIARGKSMVYRNCITKEYININACTHVFIHFGLILHILPLTNWVYPLRCKHSLLTLIYLQYPSVIAVCALHILRATIEASLDFPAFSDQWSLHNYIHSRKIVPIYMYVKSYNISIDIHLSNAISLTFPPTGIDRRFWLLAANH